jgi:SapC
MAKHVLLNNVEHKDLRVITRHSAELGDNVGSVLTFPTEYGDIQKEYPIFFRKDPATGEFQSIALLGFRNDENLFLDERGWNANYIPGVIARGPFLIGFQRGEPVIHVDLDNPRVSRTEGEPVFQPQGGNSPYLEGVAGVLKGIHQGMAVSKAMFEAFTALDLVQPMNVEIKLSVEQQYNLLNLYSISEEKLAKLDGAALFKLNQAGFLQGAFLALASLSNMKKLMYMQQRRDHGGRR